jgi:alkylation response protein AidB-like acyl-CoA dehydrogenase
VTWLGSGGDEICEFGDVDVTRELLQSARKNAESVEVPLDGWNEEPIGPEYAAAAAPRYFNWRKASIYGGSNEIQKGIVAKLVLEL